MGSTEEALAEADGPLPLRCASHPETETYLRCGKCGRPICARCAVTTPVGARCPACAQPRRLPTFEVTPTYYARAVAAAIALAAVGGGVAGYLRPFVPLAGMLLTLALGYVVGEGVALAVNRKRGRWLQVIAGLGVLLGVVCEQIVSLLTRAPALLTMAPLGLLAAWTLFGLLASPLALVFVALAVWIAMRRL